MPDNTANSYGYLVIEIQTMQDGSIANIATAYSNELDAASKFHTILAAAAKSSLPCHAASWLRADGSLIDCSYFTH